MIELSNVQIAIGRETLGEFSFSVATGSYAVLMGPTGVGKTTILEAICGLRSIRQGTIHIEGRDVTGLSPAQRNIGYVPQDLALFPHLTVREQLGFALKLRRENVKGIHDRIDQIADWLGITRLLSRRITHLSGGEAQRVALGRALSFRPGVLLLDEPLSALDEVTRSAAQAVLSDINARTNVTILHVTHSVAEANELADIRIDLTRDSETGKFLVRQEDANTRETP